MKHIGIFNTSGDVQTAIENEALLNPYVAKVSGALDYNSVQPAPVPECSDSGLCGDYPNCYDCAMETYLTFEIVSAGTLEFDQTSGLEVNINDGGWVSYEYDVDHSHVYSAGDTIKARANWGSIGGSILATGNTSAWYKVYGNINSLVLYDEYGDPNAWITDTNSHSYSRAFFENTGLTDASDLIIPSDHFSDYDSCASMFQRCSNLTGAPALPALDLSNSEYCYASMFEECTSLVTAPALPATQVVGGTALGSNCYNRMFAGCTSLEVAPVLAATNLTDYCYASMFFECSSLSAITCLATDITANMCIDSWVYGVAEYGEFTRASAGMNAWTKEPDGSGIPFKWTVIPPADCSGISCSDPNESWVCCECAGGTWEGNGYCSGVME